MKSNIKRLLELERLVAQGVDDERVKALRKELGQDMEASESKHAELEKRYFRLRAFDLTEREICFALGISSRTVAEMKAGYTNEEMEERIDYYEDHRLVKNYKKQRKRRWNYEL